MTGFSAIAGQNGPIKWVWELRGVNGKGIDIRFRLPEGTEKLEKSLRDALGKICHRGSISVSLRVDRTQSDGDIRINETALETAVAALGRAQGLAKEAGLEIAEARVSDLLAIRGVAEPVSAGSDAELWHSEAQAQIPMLVADFGTMREAEGAELTKTIAAQIAELEALIAQAAQSAEARTEGMRDKLASRMEALLQTGVEADSGRLEQELAILAIKADVTEEIDRLTAHVTAARDMLAAKGPIGRKFDFLMQEFNREANTLCSKSGSTELTQIGLSMKTLIDQMREQVQNIE